MQINTFKDLPYRCKNLEELGDGVLLYEMLAQIAPKFFDPDIDGIKKDVGSNWGLRLTNLKKLQKNLISFYEETLDQKISLDDVDMTSIAKSGNKKSLLVLLEWILGAAVQCDGRDQFIMEIMQLDEEDQRYIMLTVQGIMSKSAVSAEEEPVGKSSPIRDYASSLDDSNAGPLSRSPRTDSVDIDTIRGEKTQLETELGKARQAIKALELELQDVKEATARAASTPTKKEVAEEKGSGKSLAQALARLELAESTVKELNIVIGQKEALLLSQSKVSDGKVVQLEENLRRMADELDVTKAQLAQSSRSEASLQKMKAKLEDMEGLKDQIKSLEQSNNGYLNKIFDLEQANKNYVSLKAQLDTYKDKVVDLETALSQATTNVRAKEEEVKTLNQRMAEVESNRKFLDDQLKAAKRTNDELHGELLEHGGGGSGGGLDLASAMGGGDLKEKVIRLEREIKVLRAGGAVAGDDNIQLKLLENEIDDLKRVKARLEKSSAEAIQKAADATRKLEDYMTNAPPAPFTRSDSEVSLPPPASDKAIAKLTEKLLEQEEGFNKKLAANSELVEELKRGIKGKEEEVAKMSAEKLKLENYIKQALTHAHSNIKKQEKEFALKENQLSEQISRQKEMISEKDAQLDWFKKNDKDKSEAHKREERLLFSAVHQAGYDILKLHQPTSTLGRGVPMGEGPEMISWLAKERSKRAASRKTPSTPIE